MRTSERAVLQAVHHTGALTLRRLVADYGPYPNWRGLLDTGLMVERATVYGAVVGYSVAGYRWACESMPSRPAYLQGPGALADRAYQADAVALLQARGYEVVSVAYKRGRKPDTRTDHIVNMTLRAPLERVPDRRDSLRDDGLVWRPTRGYPYLYASISGGGITPARLRALLKVHEFSPAAWGHPLLIATPNPAALRPMLRRLETARSTPTPLVELLDLPVPQLVSNGRGQK